MELTCYFDFISPFAYLGWHAGKDVAREIGATLTPRPVLFAGLLNHWGQLGPAEVPPKREYIFKQVMRRAHDQGLCLSPPPAHPFNPLSALRVVTAALRDPRLGDPERLIDVLFAATWGGGQGVADAAHVERALNAAGLDGPALIAAASEAEIKAALRSSTDEAIAAGVFGVPTFEVGGEQFWGADSLPDLARYVAGEDPEFDLERWRNLPAAAHRPR